MARRVFAVFVLSGLCQFVDSLYHHQYHFVNESKEWSEAQQYCRATHTDLATVNDEHDLAQLASLVDYGVPYVYIGLYRSWGWSLSEDDDYKEGEPAFWNWASGEPMNHFCGSISSTGEWYATDCNVRMSFFCYDGFAADISERFTFVDLPLDWLSAQAHCRNMHTDLARVRNQLENALLQSKVGSLVWFGLTRMSWMWSDGSEPTFVPWEPLKVQDAGLGDYAAIDVDSSHLGMIERSSAEKRPFFCYSGKQLFMP
ncbi:C-type mannose receptor 2-like [Mugil cephalus]|uniref:C-type mannose receptor 2-like n=1 Tax=Mugil cephalus TaxID=48193 RepID=UPI001FB7A835|nr:C-type mannose receptor 2-like [Mugil cephalus]